jgi:hypothetical protein
MINQITCVRFQDWIKRIKLIVFSNIGSPLPKWGLNDIKITKFGEL